MTTNVESHRIERYAQNTSILAYSVNNKKYDRYIKKVLDRINQDKSIVSVQICLACTLQKWNKLLEGCNHEKALLLAKKDGDIIETKVDEYAKNILGEKYAGITRWYDYVNHCEYLNERNKFGALCKKDLSINVLRSLVNHSNRDDLLKDEHNIRSVFNNLLQGNGCGEITWETAMAASIFDYAISVIKKNNPQKKPEMYEGKSFTDLLNVVFDNCYEYLAEESVIAYKFWDYNRLLYFGAITPILNKAHEEFVLKKGAKNKLWWQEIKLVDDINIEESIKNYIAVYLRSQKLQVKKDLLLNFTNSITDLLNVINEIQSKEIKCLLRLLAANLVTVREQIFVDGKS